MKTQALSLGWYVDLLMRGPAQPAVALGRGHLRVGGYVVSLTRPGAPRMPNGIECDMTIKQGAQLVIGDGAITSQRNSVTRGAIWDATPEVNMSFTATPCVAPNPSQLIGQGKGLTPEGDDALIGFIAGRVLFGRVQKDRGPGQSTDSTTSLSSTLLMHARRGELAEPAHALLSEGDPEPLFRFGHSSGRAMLLGIALACPQQDHEGPPSLVTKVGGLELFPDTTIRIFPRGSGSKSSQPLQLSSAR